ncbi:hypothetical protein TRFO_04226 [Tritrichomonas foetus]|uniref:Phosphoprotein phosphatase n=1 Tax=Tritrichomonas foetus TaxID=1144522 RepID=A0A1J4KH70_9EUKA|nr:hypothetical protein TRFO_04226 [Tritrichomonas foetus]|eukprot:OHT10697.1 hypothetical protein TRFO_04226 [Tritrichomonas foetus]
MFLTSRPQPRPSFPKIGTLNQTSFQPSSTKSTKSSPKSRPSTTMHNSKFVLTSQTSTKLNNYNLNSFGHLSKTTRADANYRSTLQPFSSSLLNSNYGAISNRDVKEIRATHRRKREPLFGDPSYDIYKMYGNGKEKVDKYGHSRNDLLQLLKRCNYANDIQNIPLNDEIQQTKLKYGTDLKLNLPHNKESNEWDDEIVEGVDSSDRKVRDFDSIMLLLKDDDFIKKCKYETYELIFLTIRINILRKMKPIPVEFYLADKQVKFKVNLINRILICHKLFIFFLQNVDLSNLIALIDQTFIKNFLNIFDTPDSSEQTSLANVTIAIFDNIPNYQKFIFNCLLKKLQQHSEGYSQYYSATTSLLALSKLFGRASDIVLKQMLPVFKEYVIPLFKSDQFAAFSEEMNLVCKQFYSNVSKSCECVLEYLIIHWPVSNTSKEIAYLNHLMVMMPFYKLSLPNKRIFRMFEKINHCLVSPCQQVCKSAMKLISNQLFLTLFSCFHTFVIPPLIGCLNNLQDYWCQDVIPLRMNAMKLLAPINSKLTQAVPVKSRTSQIADEKLIGQKWKQMGEFANQAYSDFNYSNIEDEFQRKVIDVTFNM